MTVMVNVSVITTIRYYTSV